jgi:hypothetical protein
MREYVFKFSVEEGGSYHEPKVAGVFFLSGNVWVRAAEFGSAFLLEAAAKRVYRNIEEDLKE